MALGRLNLIQQQITDKLAAWPAGRFRDEALHLITVGERKFSPAIPTDIGILRRLELFEAITALLHRSGEMRTEQGSELALQLISGFSAGQAAIDGHNKRQEICSGLTDKRWDTILKVRTTAA